MYISLAVIKMSTSVNDLNELLKCISKRKRRYKARKYGLF